MDLEGRVTIDLSRLPGGPAQVSYVQPGDIGRVLCGRTPDEALRLVPALYSVCGTAQAHAAVTALERALGQSPSPRTLAARQALTAMETLREHALRIALDWPAFVAAPARPERMRPVMRLVPDLSGALFGRQPAFALGREAVGHVAAVEAVIDMAEAVLVDEIFGEPLSCWRSRRGEGELLDWACRAATLAGRLVAQVAAAGWQGAGAVPPAPVTGPSMARMRDWLTSGRDSAVIFPPAGSEDIPETTLLTRRADDPLLAGLAGGGLAARLVARLVELAHLPDEMRRAITEPDNGLPAPAPASGDGFGFAAVEAARGLLIHAVGLREGRIGHYGILPPTRWNFDPDGVAKRCLSGLRSADDAVRLRQAQLIVNAIDPCVGHEVRLH